MIEQRHRVLAIVFIGIITSGIIYWHHDTINQNIYQIACVIPTDDTNSTKLILTWTALAGQNIAATVTQWLANRTACRHKCIYTNDKSMASSADAFIFHTGDQLSQLPAIRHPHQRYIFFQQESPYHSGPYETLPVGFFNLTMTYRRDSDIVMYYDAFVPIRSTDPIEWRYTSMQVHAAIARKSRMVLQFVSHCVTESRREIYVKALVDARLSIDIVGACAKNSRVGCAYGSECEFEMISAYRFYLAFENSVCRDYVTEKFWRLKRLIVPIVLRQRDYVNVAPIGSYIAADQFESPAHLVAHLEYLASNHTAYLTYFEWTKTYRRYDSSRQFGFSYWAGHCELCALLHNRSAPAKVYRDMHNWWMNEADCDMGFAERLARRRESIKL